MYISRSKRHKYILYFEKTIWRAIGRVHCAALRVARSSNFEFLIIDKRNAA